MCDLAFVKSEKNEGKALRERNQAKLQMEQRFKKIIRAIRVIRVIRWGLFGVFFFEDFVVVGA
ncbi:MAG: hypothetical protein K2K94_04640, partial [Muribaculaceae bacterium]|nr:hypothetical protein [Muribaculaceae bacterium]